MVSNDHTCEVIHASDDFSLDPNTPDDLPFMPYERGFHRGLPPEVPGLLKLPFSPSPGMHHLCSPSILSPFSPLMHYLCPLREGPSPFLTPLPHEMPNFPPPHDMMDLPLPPMTLTISLPPWNQLLIQSLTALHPWSWTQTLWYPHLPLSGLMMLTLKVRFPAWFRSCHFFGSRPCYKHEP